MIGTIERAQLGNDQFIDIISIINLYYLSAELEQFRFLNFNITGPPKIALVTDLQLYLVRF